MKRPLKKIAGFGAGYRRLSLDRDKNEGTYRSGGGERRACLS